MGIRFDIRIGVESVSVGHESMCSGGIKRSSGSKRYYTTPAFKELRTREWTKGYLIRSSIRDRGESLCSVGMREISLLVEYEISRLGRLMSQFCGFG